MSRNSMKRYVYCPEKRNRIEGFSLIELLIVLIVMAILTVISVPYFYNYTKLYKSDDQALRVIDLMRETSQLALTRRRTFRFEIDRTDNKIYIIDENNAGASDDTEIKGIPLDSSNDLRMDRIPTGITAPNPPNYTDASYGTDTIGHKRGGTTITGHTVWAARFQRDGSVVNAAGTPLSANLYVWAPLVPGSTTDHNPKDKKLVRCITLFGGSGAVRYWKHNGTTFVAN